MVWDESHVNLVDVYRGRMRVAENDDHGWEVHYVGPDITTIMLTTDSKPAAITYAERIYR